MKTTTARRAYGFTDNELALAFPEWAIRAVIALSLIVLFVAMAVFPYQGMAGDGPANRIENIAEDLMAQMTSDIAVAKGTPVPQAASWIEPGGHR